MLGVPEAIHVRVQQEHSSSDPRSTGLEVFSSISKCMDNDERKKLVIIEINVNK